MGADNLTNLLDALTETSVYVIEEESRRLLYFNRRCRESARGRAALGAKCHAIWPEVCANCPIDAMGEGSSSHIVCYDPLQKTTVDVTANRIDWEGGVRAVVVTVAPHRLNFEEERGLKKIEQMYAKSLVTVFDECVIVNLSADYYVNCQKDVLWAGIPERGNFGAENFNYSAKVMHPDDLPAFDQTFSREALLRLFAAGKKQVRKRLRRRTAGGAYRMTEFNAARLEMPGETDFWCVLVFRDVQEEELLERRRNVEISQLATAARIAYQMLIAVNLTQNTYHMLAYERFPVEEPDSAGCFNDLIAFELAAVHPDYREEFSRKFLRPALIDAFSRGERIVTMEVPHMGRDGAYHWHFTQVVRVESPYTEDLIEITLSRNIDEERRLRTEALAKERRAKRMLEAALENAERASRAKSDFLSKMSHDIRTPLNAIVGMTELALLQIGDAEKLRDYLQKIASSGAHLLGLVNEVLDVSKIESGTVELAEDEFDLRELAREVVELVRLPLEKKRQEFSVEMDEGLHPRVIGDARRLKQVLVNIIENAAKYTPPGGRISFGVAELERTARQVGTYRFTVEDNGIGMKPEYLAHIFEPFSRADDSRISKVAGTGLGMTIVKSLVSMMDGQIQVESEYQKGSRFFVTLSLTQCDAPAAAEEKPRAEASFAAVRALLVEDNEINRQIAAEMLALLGVRAEIAEDGRRAVEVVCSRPPRYYDIVFMDVQMPVLNGYDATRQIRASGIAGADTLPIVAMTADVFADDVKRARLSGMNGHLAKPISLEQLKAALSRYLA